ncbi:DUF4442 domain-containing protein [Albibacterium sp.]|uniref:DUF4442 domain-containing protein n=1 Tax=Albibacterium sp. TaxID=2952885 RepID=UPI002B5D1B89|nr:DUF4442 domain-containing protein [Albibacterium sp.]HUH18587.1 DUF4442 domain-containing protein [Albibacterium sp.]
MQASENLLKWAMRLYPPLFFQRIWVQRFHKNFRGVDVKINHSLITKNYNSSIFGGTIFSATDPFYAILFDQVFKRKGYTNLVWLKSAEIKYIKPAKKNLFFTIKISEEDINYAEQHLQQEGKYVSSFDIDLYDADGILYVKVKNEIYIRNLNFNSNHLNKNPSSL